MTPPADQGYPDQSTCDDKLYNSLLDLPGRQAVDLTFLRQNVWTQAVNFSVPRDRVVPGMQANMFTILMEDGAGVERRVVVKRVVPAELPAKSGEEAWRSFLISVRTEMEFYRELRHPDHRDIQQLFPQVYFSSGTSRELDSRPKETSFSMVMEDLSISYFQKPAMNRHEAQCVMESLARLHSHYWGQMEVEDRGSFWVLDLRKAFKEVEQAEETWSDILTRFPEMEQEVGVGADIRKLGGLLASRAGDLDRFVAKGAVTRIHGDAKGWNFFFLKDTEEKEKSTGKPPFLLIDMQWTGRGHPLQDVAYALTTSLEEAALPEMDQLVDFYVGRLGEMLALRGIELNKEKLRAEYDKVWLDYARVIVTGLWRRLSKESMVKNRDKVGPSMINRSWGHVLFITRRIARLLL